MLCDKCKVNSATVHVVEVINGKKQELNICENCTKSLESFTIQDDISMDSPFTFQNVLSGLVNYINKASHSAMDVEVGCPKCGMSYFEFKQLGLMGCSDCYKSFGPFIIPVIKRVQGSTEHVGKIPLKAGNDIMQRKKLEGLRELLQKAILAEEYEKAAELRDKIRELQNTNKEV